MTLREFPKKTVKKKTVKSVRKSTFMYPYGMEATHENWTSGRGQFGIMRVDFVLSSSAGGFSARETHTFYETRGERRTALAELRKRMSTAYGSFAEAFDMVEVFRW